MWRSPSQQDQSFHESLLNAFNYLGSLAETANHKKAVDILIRISECDEVGPGNSATRIGKRFSKSHAEEVLRLFSRLPHYKRGECQHMEEIQLYVDGISKDRISDLACNFIKSFLINFTIDQCENLNIPLEDAIISGIYSQRKGDFVDNQKEKLPLNPETGKPIIFVPKRWLRFVPWISYEDYFRSYCPQDDIAHKGEILDRVKVLQYNRDNNGAVEEYVRTKERTFEDCLNDSLFKQVPIVSAKRQLNNLKN